MAILTWQEGDSGIIRWQYGSTLAGIGFLSIGIGFGRFGVVGVLEYVKADRVRAPFYRCSSCKHEWPGLPD